MKSGIVAALSSNYIKSNYIKYIKSPICVNCIHYIEYKKNYPWHEIPNNRYGICAKFGSKHLITGEIKYELASVCRQDKTKCGEDGEYFSPL